MKELTTREFADELIDYINNHIIPHPETTKIAKVNCDYSSTIKGMPLNIILREDEEVSAGPTYYIEGLMQDYPRMSIPAIGEKLNINVSEFYETWEKQYDMLRSIVTHMPVASDVEPEKTIVTTELISNINKKAPSDVLRKDFPDLNLTLFVKVQLDNYGKDAEQHLYGFVKKSDDEDFDEERLWQIALANTYANTPIGIRMTEDFTLTVADMGGFTPLFYLFFDKMFDAISQKFEADQIYIMPIDTHQAQLVLVPNSNIEEDADTRHGVAYAIEMSIDAIKKELSKRGINDRIPFVKYDVQSRKFVVI